MIYAFNDGAERRDLWSKLGVIAQRYQDPWALAGDFNTVINPIERMGGDTRQNDMDEFISCQDECGMTHIAATGAFYTWNNKQEPLTRVYSRLDKFLINQEWLTRYPDMRAHFHPEGLFDHCPCTVSKILIGDKKRTSFKYFNMWSKSPSFLIRVQEEWQKHYEGHKMFSVLVQDPQNALLINKEIETAVRVKELIEARNSYLSQKVKMQWLEAGDNNTTYFHGTIKKKNSLNKTLLGDNKPTEKVRRQVLSEGKCCTKYHVEILNKAVTNDDIKSIFFSIPIDKSPGPDGYTSAFFKDTWDIVGADVCASIKDFFATGKLLTQINATNITLIPKCDRPTSVKQFRSIACCNMIYKVISKLLYNRLAQVLPDIISENQGAFIKGRSIIENVLICQDLVKMYNRKAVSPRCLFDIDLQKAYDTVEWDFVEQLFKSIQFLMPSPRESWSV
ncbi:uncharacterized protein LOC141628475 [Silene latifolia]|uniref:uncharacterized protein LOC141628475 n=1 Tax=Silene latifolia TaxID=37657 RepID=UPI003D77907D